MNALRVSTVGLVLALISAAPVSAASMERSDRAAGDMAPDFELPAVVLRISLSRAMGEHAMLLVETLGAGLAGTDQSSAAAAALEGNTASLVDLIEQAYGADAAEAFATQWRNHIAYLVDYTQAVADDADDARQLAERQLEQYVDDFTELLAAANPTLPADVIRELIAEHGDQLSQIGHLAAGEHEVAYTHIRDTYAHMYEVADALTTGILDQSSSRFPGRDVAFSLAMDLRMALDRLLGEHAMLAAVTMRARLSEAADVEAAARALEGNTADIADRVATIYGREAGETFAELWRSHTGYYIDYVGSVATEDNAGRQSALQQLRGYEARVAEFLADASPLLDRDQLEGMLHTHTTQLTSMVDAYAERDFDHAYEVVRSAYAHTKMLAAGLGGAIADQFPQRFPDTAVPPIGQADNDLGRTGRYLIVAAAIIAAAHGLQRRRDVQRLQLPGRSESAQPRFRMR